MRDAKFIDHISGTNFRLPEHMVVGRVALAGDAAHARSALGGTGLAGGVQDATNLGWKLALALQGGAAPGLVQSYEEEQQAEAIRIEEYVKSGGGIEGGAGSQRGRAIDSGRLYDPVVDGSPSDLTVDQVIDHVTDVLPELVHEHTAIRAMMNVHHRGFSLTRDDGRPAPAPVPRREYPPVADPPGPEEAIRVLTDGGALVDWLCRKDPAFEAHFFPKPRDVRAGDYLPDAVVRVADEGVHLRTILRGPKANLLLCSGPDPTPEVDAALRAVETAVAPLARWLQVRYVFPSEGWASRLGHAYDQPDVIVDGQFEIQEFLGVHEPEMIYVRPDGYLGLRTRTLEVDGVVDYLGLVHDASLL
jgi:hypothetical protein